MEYEIVRLIDRPEIKKQVAQWFHEKWGIPTAAYLESIEDCLSKKNAVPQWYVAMEKDLVTDHTSFYERYGWEFLCLVQGDGESNMTRMYIHRA